MFFLRQNNRGPSSLPPRSLLSLPNRDEMAPTNAQSLTSIAKCLYCRRRGDLRRARLPEQRRPQHVGLIVIWSSIQLDALRDERVLISLSIPTVFERMLCSFVCKIAVLIFSVPFLSLVAWSIQLVHDDSLGDD